MDTVFANVKENTASAWKWKDDNWAIYLPGFSQEQLDAYVTSKGFSQMTGIYCGEGFWINSNTSQTLTVSGTQPADTSCYLTKGWNLIGLKSNQAKSITNLISGNENQIASVWKWDSGTWAVYLPGQTDGGAAYAIGKGFNELSIINPGEGFWMNCTEAVKLE